jgi:hypothetical protein
MAALAHAHHDHAARHSSMARTAFAKPFALARGQAQQRTGLDLEGARRQLQGPRGVEGLCGCSARPSAGVK